MTSAGRQNARRETLVSALLATVSALAWAACFQEEPLEILPWVALAPMLLVLGRRRTFLWGWWFGAVFWLGSMSWLTHTLHTYGGLPQVLSQGLAVLLAIYLGLGQAVFAWIGGRFWRRGGASALLGLPSLWVLLEVVRGLPIASFPWNLAAYAWVDLPGALALSAWVGAFGVSWLLVFANTCVALAIRHRQWDLAWVGILLAALLLSLAARFSRGDEGAESILQRPSGEVRVIQPDSPIVGPEEAWENYRRLIALSMEACEGAGRAFGPRLVLWPESATFPMRYASSAQLQDDVARLHRAGCEVLLGSTTFQGERYFNTVHLTTPEGIAGSYSKRRLVPWGEYIPLKEVLPFVGKLARNAGEFSPGEDVGLLPWNGEAIGLAICYEVVFPQALAEQVVAGASILATVTNDAWYGDTSAPWQHFRAVRYRAAENRRPMLRAALTGVSAMVDARGVVVEELGVGERGVISGRVRGRSDLSFFTRWPWASTWASVLLLAFAIVRARSPGSPERDHTEEV